MIRRVVSRAWRAGVRFWTQPLRAEPLALMRVCSAVSILVSALWSVGPNLSLYWFPDGLIPSEASQAYVRDYDRFSVLLWADTAAEIAAWFWVWVLSLIGVALGCLTRLSCVVAWVLAVSFNMSAVWALNGGDDVAVQLLFYLMLSPCGAVYSLDAGRRRRAAIRRGETLDAARLVAPWSIRLIQIQLIIVYLLGGLNKLNLSTTNDYLTGEALYWVFNDVTLTRWSFNSLPLPMLICRLASWLTIVFELSFGALVLVSRLRPWILVAGLMLHLGILITMEINWFGQNTVCFYPIMLSGAAADRALRALGRGWRRNAEPA